MRSYWRFQRHFAQVIRAAFFVLTAAGLSNTCGAQPAQPTTVSDSAVKVGGLDVITLTRKATGHGKKREFLSVTLFPGRGMNVFQVTAMIPGKGEVQLLESPTVAEAASLLTGTGRDKFGALSVSFGGAFFVPYGSRIFGKLSADGQSITTQWEGHTLTLPANYQGKISSTGLIRETQVGELHTQQTPDGEIQSGVIHAGNFGGHWISDTDVHFKITLSRDAVEVSVTAINVGNEAEPMGLGWHPYAAIRSGDRSQARLHLPTAMYAEADKSEVVTGKLLPVKGTPYDFTAPAGAPLDAGFFANFSKLDFAHGPADAWLSDPKMNYCLHIRVLSPEVKTMSVLAPVNRPLVAIEPQFNFPDPWGQKWQGMDTGLVTLGPGKSVAFNVRLELSSPVTP